MPFIIALIGIFVFIVLVCVAISVWLFVYAIPGRPYKSCITGDEAVDRKRLGRLYDTMKPAHDRAVAYNYEKCSITSYDGLTLIAHYLPAEKPSNKFILLAHGWTGSYYDDFCCVTEWYRTHGYNMLLIEQRAQGASEGKYMCFGCKEKRDIVSWCEYIVNRFGNESLIVLHGISMGSATVMYAAGEKLPANVKGVVADCGFTSPYREFKDVLKNNFKLPSFPFLFFANILTKLIAGFGLKDDDSVSVMKRMRLPILFIHTKTDSFVFVDNTLENYNACISEKYIYLVEDAPHAMAFCADNDGCINEVNSFLVKVFH